MRIIGTICGPGEVSAVEVAGVHIEGPYISPEDGPRGARRLEYVRNCGSFFRSAAGGGRADGDAQPGETAQL